MQYRELSLKVLRITARCSTEQIRWKPKLSIDAVPYFSFIVISLFLSHWSKPFVLTLIFTISSFYHVFVPVVKSFISLLSLYILILILISLKWTADCIQCFTGVLYTMVVIFLSLIFPWFLGIHKIPQSRKATASHWKSVWRSDIYLNI